MIYDYCQMTANFSKWLQERLDERGWKPADLVKAGIDSGFVSRLLTGERLPGVATIKKIADALNIPEVEVLRAMGKASPEPASDTPSLRELTSKFAQLSDDDQETILKLVRALEETASAQKRRGLKPKPKAG